MEVHKSFNHNLINMQNKKKFSHHDIILYQNRAKDFLIDIPANAKLVGMNKPLTQGERLAVSYMNAALSIINAKGVNTESLQIILENADSESF